MNYVARKRCTCLSSTTIFANRIVPGQVHLPRYPRPLCPGVSPTHLNRGERRRPTLHLTVGLPGVGKTTLAHELERVSGALRLTPDEWMVPLFGVRWAAFGGKRDVLEGRLIWVAHQVLRAGGSVILDFGCWSSDERYALRAIADLAVADFELHYVTLPEDERRRRATSRWREAPEETFEMTLDDHERFRTLFTRKRSVIP